MGRKGLGVKKNPSLQLVIRFVVSVKKQRLLAIFTNAMEEMDTFLDVKNVQKKPPRRVAKDPHEVRENY